MSSKLSRPIATVSADGATITHKCGVWSIRFPVSDLPKWLSFYEAMRDRKGGAYRSAAYFARKKFYGEQAARDWENEAEERHEYSRAIWKSREEKRLSRNVEIPEKRSPTTGMELQ